MNDINSILVIIDPTVMRDHVVERAKLLSQQLEAGVELFINNYQSTGFEENILENLEKEFSALQLSVTTVFRSDKNLTDAIVNNVKLLKPDIVLKSTHGHNLLKQTLLSNTDWQLIRDCPAPLLLVKPSAWHNNGSVVAAVDPLHNKAEQTNLDHLLIEHAEYFEQQFNQKARVFHSYYPFSNAMHPKKSKSIEENREVKKIHNQKIYQLLSSHNIDPVHVEIVRGDLVDELLNYLKVTSSNVLVIGALSRSGLEKFIVGSTAEKILDSAPCDILIIKPV